MYRPQRFFGGSFNDCPGLIVSDRNPLYDLIVATEYPVRREIADKVSPLRTVTYVGFATGFGFGFTTTFFFAAGFGFGLLTTGFGFGLLATGFGLLATAPLPDPVGLVTFGFGFSTSTAGAGSL
ncbi:MAG: hypothetical protein DVB22_001191 [Verrucomicrobia bacterium]|nr:MAG: hypothetical protein DVB22_001191 [Verrucomicrobiota bacterium]